MDRPDLLTSIETAVAFQRSVKTIERWDDDPDDELKSFRFGRTRLFPRALVERLAAERNGKAAS